MVRYWQKRPGCQRLILAISIADCRTASVFAASGMGGALIGAKFTHLVSAAMLLLLFGTLMLVVGTGTLRHGETKTASHECRLARCLATGAAVGALTGFLGVCGL